MTRPAVGDLDLMSTVDVLLSVSEASVLSFKATTVWFSSIQVNSAHSPSCMQQITAQSLVSRISLGGGGPEIILEVIVGRLKGKHRTTIYNKNTNKNKKQNCKVHSE